MVDVLTANAPPPKSIKIISAATPAGPAWSSSE